MGDIRGVFRISIAEGAKKVKAVSTMGCYSCFLSADRDAR